MPRRKVQLVNGEFYHIAKRGTEEREIFLDDEDRFRFVNSLLVFNDKMPAPWESRAFWHQRNPATSEPYCEIVVRKTSWQRQTLPGYCQVNRLLIGLKFRECSGPKGRPWRTLCKFPNWERLQLKCLDQ